MKPSKVYKYANPFVLQVDNSNNNADKLSNSLYWVAFWYRQLSSIICSSRRTSHY